MLGIFKGAIRQVLAPQRISLVRNASMMVRPIINNMPPITPIAVENPLTNLIGEMIMTSVLRKRRLKMKKHKLRKRRKAQRALRIKIGK